MTELPRRGFPAGPRGVEVAMLRSALPWLALIVPAALVISWVTAGVDGLVSAVIGSVIGVANLIASAVVMERGARIGAQALMAVALGSYIVRLAVLTAAFWLLTKLEFIVPVVLGVVLAGTYLALLTAEALVVVASDRTDREVFAKLRPSSIDSSDGD